MRDGRLAVTESKSTRIKVKDKAAELHVHQRIQPWHRSNIHLLVIVQATCAITSAGELKQLLQAELEGGEWVDLLGPDHPGIAEVKWCANRFTPFLCIDPEKASAKGKQDAEEFIEVQAK